MKANWIKPEDGLPPNSEFILIYSKYNVTKSECVSPGWYDESSKSWFNYLGYKIEDADMKIIAWTHLPDPPKM